MIPEDGCYPYSKTLDTIGPLAKSVEDVVNLFNALVDRVRNPHAPDRGYGFDERKTWKDISIATLDPEVWRFPESMQASSDDIREQIVRSWDLW